tara:strand:+ start:184 stop:498 length:315 start_codon:yes stop_codon:yes gene_type:complete
MKVSNFKSPKGNSVPNQFLISDHDGTEYYQSYRSIIAVRAINGKIFLNEDSWDYSRTTSRYRNEFLGETTKETKEKIKSGEYKLTDQKSLNNIYSSRAFFDVLL